MSHSSYGKKSVLALIFVGLLTCQGVAQIEPIGPITIVGGQPVDYFFTNLIPPNPDRKLLDFLGEAFNPGSTTLFLDVMYDWVDQNGVTQFFTPPNSPFAIPPGGPFPVDPGPLVLPFCPDLVSLHFAMDFGELDLQGNYAHICFPVPEPSLAAMLCGMFVSLVVGRRRRSS